MNPFDLTGRVALVTGAGRGIGEACAVGLAEAGAELALAARSADQIEKVAAKIREIDGHASTHVLDVRSVPDVRRLVADVSEQHGGIDILVNNAGTNVQQEVLDVSEETWDVVIDTNLKGAFFCAQEVGRRMVERGKGKIINMASTFAGLGFPGRVSYAASKGGLMQFTRVMAIEWAAHGVNVNAVGPTATSTPMNAPLFDDAAYRSEVVSRIPAGRLAEPADVVGPVVFLASSASDMVNGHLLLVDGGWSAI